VYYLTVCVNGTGAGVDSALEQYKLEARKMLDAKRGDESHLPSACFVGCDVLEKSKEEYILYIFHKYKNELPL
jgi:hypothetical protein